MTRADDTTTAVNDLLDRRSVANIGWLSADRLVAVALQFLAGVLVVRHLGPERFGLLSWSNALVWLFVPLVGLGLDEFVRREWAVREPTERGGALRAATRLRLGVGIAAAAVVVVLAATVAPARAELGTVLLAAGLLAQPFATAMIPFEVELESSRVTRWRLVVAVGVAGFQVLGVVLGASLMWFYVASTLALAGPPAVAWVLYRRRFRPTASASPQSHDRALLLLRGAFPFLVAAVSGSLSMRVDQLMLESLAGIREVGLYAAAVRISEAPHFLPVIIVASLFGRTARGDAQAREARVRGTYDLLTLVAVVIAVAVAVAAPWAVRIAFGASYAEAATVLRIHAFGLVALTWNVARWQMLVLDHRQWVGAGAAAAGALLNVAANLLLIPLWGASGAAVATVVSFTAEAVVVGAVVPELRPTTRTMLRSLARVPRTTGQLVSRLWTR